MHLYSHAEVLFAGKTFFEGSGESRMSASQDKKRRSDERVLGTERRQVASQKEAKERKQSKIKWTVGTVIVVLLVVAILLGNSSLFYTARPALQVGDVKYSSAEVNYAYRTAYLSFCNQYSSILSSIGFDTKKPLDEQKCTISEEFDTWDDYFKNAAKQNLVQVTALCDAAKKAGITLDEDDQHEVDEQFSYIELSAKQYKYSSVSKYLQAVYGNGVTKKVARHMLELSQLASKYSQQQYDSYTYTDEQIAENYAENKNSYDVFNYQCYLVQAATEETTGADGNTSTATTDATMAAAKATADKIAAATHDADSFAAAVTANVPATTAADGKTTTPSVTSNTNAKGSSVSSAPYAEWLYSAERTANNVTVVEQENTGYYVVLFQSRDDNSYNTVSARHILIKAEDSDNDGTYSDDDKQKAKASIDDVYERWMQSDQTEDDFAQLANSFSQDSGSNTKGGLYEHIYKGQMVQEFNDFCFDPARKPGDVGMVFNESDSYCGYHLVYFVGQGERYCDYLADQALRSADFEKWESAFFNDWSATELNGMKYVG